MSRATETGVASNRDHPLFGALARAHAFRTLAQALATPTDTTLLDCELAAWHARSSGALADALARARAALRTERELLLEEHDGLLAGRAGIPVREISYADPRHLAPTELADIAGFFRAFGLQPATEAPDHIASQCELASCLALKEAYAAAEGWEDHAEVAMFAYQRLLADHLVRWIPDFATRLRAGTLLEFYVAISDALDAQIRAEAERLGVAIPDETAASGCPGDEPGLCEGAGCGSCDEG